MRIPAPLRTFAAAACYGFSLGTAHDLLYASRNLVKFPLLLAATAVICALSYWITAQMFGARISFLASQRMSWRLFHDASILLASLSPAVLFVALVLRYNDDGQLGEYDFFLAANIGLVAAAGGLALLHRARFMLAETGLSLTRSLGVLVAWLALALFVGGQVAFLLRPFFGFPATRGNDPPWFLWNEPDARGARNFYQAAWQTLEGRELDPEPRWRH